MPFLGAGYLLVLVHEKRKCLINKRKLLSVIMTYLHTNVFIFLENGIWASGVAWLL